MRTILAAIVGGILMFFWGFAWHMGIGYDHKNIKTFTKDDPVMSALKENTKGSGFYFFPGRDMSGTLSPEAEKVENDRFTEKYKAGPRGILIYSNETAEDPMSPKKLIIEFVSNVICALLAAMIICKSCGSYFCRVLTVAAIGLAATAAIDVSYWNWYNFPDHMVIGSFVEQGVGFLVMGLGVAAIVKKGTAA